MKVALFVLLFGLTTPNLFPAGRSFLEPAEGYFSSYDHSHRSMSLIRNVLLKGASDKPLARMVRPGSFDPLSGDVVSLIEQNGSYTVELRTTNVDIVIDVKPEDVRVTVLEATIDKDTANLIAEIFYAATSQTSYREDSGPVPDGSFYIFSSFRVGVGLRAGCTWSPESKSILGTLANFGYILHEYVRASNQDRITILLKLNSDGTALLKRLHKNA